MPDSAIQLLVNIPLNCPLTEQDLNDIETDGIELWAAHALKLRLATLDAVEIASLLTVSRAI